MNHKVQVDADTTGLEHILVLAVKGEEKEPVDFTDFAQPGIGNPKGQSTPLGQLLRRCTQGKGEKGQARKQVDACFLDLIPVRTLR